VQLASQEVAKRLAERDSKFFDQAFIVLIKRNADLVFDRKN
jgi:hypothetical protein